MNYQMPVVTIITAINKLEVHKIYIWVKITTRWPRIGLSPKMQTISVSVKKCVFKNSFDNHHKDYNKEHMILWQSAYSAFKLYYQPSLSFPLTKIKFLTPNRRTDEIRPLFYCITSTKFHLFCGRTSR